MLFQLAAPTVGPSPYFAIIHVEVTQTILDKIAMQLTDEIGRHLRGARLTVFARNDGWFATVPLFPTSFAFFGPDFPPPSGSLIRSPTFRCTTGVGQQTQCEKIDMPADVSRQR